MFSAVRGIVLFILGELMPLPLVLTLSLPKAERAATDKGIEVLGLHRVALQGKCINGLLMGFAAFSEREIGQAIVKLAAVLEREH